jgi:magnesium chelatase family protein
VLASLRTAAVAGIDACLVHVEVDVSFGLPVFTMVGLPDAGMRESRDRVKSAVRNAGFEFPPHRVTVNLAPADVRKAGASFDLPIALGILAAQGVIERREIHDVVVLGELSLDGSIHPTRGVLPVAVAARHHGATAILLPRQNAGEAAIVAGLTVWPAESLREAVAILNAPANAPVYQQVPPARRAVPYLDLVDVKGQLLARRALEVAAAGGHNLLMVGPPGAGKTLLARRMPGILPPLSADEALEVTAIHSVAGLLPEGSGLITERPFRAPHHTISNVALTGGVRTPRPGEISLAHHGVLFLDEMLEFHRSVLEGLRQPLEEGSLVVMRAMRSVSFPARFVLVGAANPCPCGYAGDPNRPCRCTPENVARYRARLSGPLRDRIDLTVDVPAVDPEVLEEAQPGEPSSAVRQRVIEARARQHARMPATGALTNATLTPSALTACCALDAASRRLLSTAMRRLGLTARAYDRIRKVARTLADLEGVDAVSVVHLAEALQFRAMP